MFPRTGNSLASKFTNCVTVLGILTTWQHTMIRMQSLPLEIWWQHIPLLEILITKRKVQDVKFLRTTFSSPTTFENIRDQENEPLQHNTTQPKKQVPWFLNTETEIEESWYIRTIGRLTGIMGKDKRDIYMLTNINQLAMGEYLWW